ncbi:ABC transporter substrate-binding protein [Roseateles sp. DAIF2]|uniref:ABC transporter substrate-binding protein n=1 Tax=Roseateles sp. DAIF2 TaxID=2714952 RepID=UPI0018A2C55B|nr:ABC transporter substrate-binding protein [Roseateles sp. DAIF2]QPF73266.1 ABC transporter substrate-binding protein [Roseateles sp. DAIF2]
MQGLPGFAALRGIGLALAAAAATLALTACNNSPYELGAAKSNTIYNSFDERSPRYLDPTASYSNPESVYTYQIYEPLYAYHYLKRPYQLVPKVAERVVHPYYLDKDGKRLPDDAPADQIAQSVYDIPIKKGIKFQPHPALAKDDKGNYLYHHLTREQLGAKRSPWDFPVQGTRELVAEDYVYAIKRHATPRIEAPIFAIFSEYVLGLKDYAKLVREENAKLLKGLPETTRDKPFLDFRQWPLEGAQAVDSHTLRVRIKGKYPQWQYWMAMTFVSPLPWEADAFYAQPGMAENSMSLNQWPLGTGPYMMTEYVQDRRHVMKRNPNYRGEPYPCEGSEADRKAGLLDDCGKTMPFADTIVSTIVKEKVPRKELFKQGYLDVPEIERPEWGVDFQVDMDDSDEVKAAYQAKGFKFPLVTDINSWYLGFNWMDPVVGKGDTPEQQLKNRKLRQALSIAIDWEEGYGRIFRAKGGVAAHGPVPPGVFGSREEEPGYFNPVTHRLVNGEVQRRPIEDALKLLAEAGYPDGRDAKTGKPLVLSYDYQRTTTPEIKAELDWMVKQFAKLGVQLEIRATDYNQFQDKVLKGKHQIFWWGWLADYPDAENFLFLLYGPNSKSKHEGENTANYENPEYDRLYRRMQTLDDGPEKQKVIDQMVQIAREDSPWAWGYWPYVGLAFQPWVYNGKPGIMIRDMARYYRVDPQQRAAKQAEWNRPIWWPLLLLLAGAAAIIWTTRSSFRARELATAKGYDAARNAA